MMTDEYEWPYLLELVPDHSTFHSPLMLCQEAVGGASTSEHQWRTVLASMLCKRTSRRQSHPALWRFLYEWPSHHNVAFAPRDAHRRMRELLKPCGFQNRRTDEIIDMSRQWTMGLRPEDDLDGCGQYVLDAYRIFALGRLEAPKSEDGHLAAYVSWALIERARIRRAGT